jgi:hypothetical protein
LEQVWLIILTGIAIKVAIIVDGVNTVSFVGRCDVDYASCVVIRAGSTAISTGEALHSVRIIVSTDSTSLVAYSIYIIN